MGKKNQDTNYTTMPKIKPEVSEQDPHDSAKEVYLMIPWHWSASELLLPVQWDDKKLKNMTSTIDTLNQLKNK